MLTHFSPVRTGGSVVESAQQKDSGSTTLAMPIGSEQRHALGAHGRQHVASPSNAVDAVELTERLGGRWHSGRNYGSARCIVHSDQHPSLSISNGDNGKLLVKCHTGCAQSALVDELKSRGLWPEGQPVPKLRVHRGGKEDQNGAYSVPDRRNGSGEVAVYDYRDETGTVLYQAVRFEPKVFRQRRVLEDGSKAWGLEGVRLVLYRLPELLAADPFFNVFVVEGEKDADRLASLGLVATTSAMGAGKWRDEYAEFLRDRQVVVIPDNDRVGREHADTVVTSLVGVAASVKLLTLEGLPDKGDVSDWLDAGHSDYDLEARAAAVEPLGKPRPEYPIRTLAELMAQEHEPGAQILEGLVWKGKVHWLFARAGTGKTVWALIKGLHIAAGKEFCGRRVEQGPVLFISEDSPDSVIQEYVETLCELYDIDWDDIPFYINEHHGLRIETVDDLPKAKEAFESCPQEPIHVIIDSCESLVPSESFNLKEFDAFGQFLRWVSDRGPSIEVVDHARKETKDSNNNLLEKLYGSIAKGKVADIAVYLEGSFRDGHLTAKYAKFRGNFPPSLEIGFHSDTGFTLRDVLGTEFTPTEQAITKWFNHTGSGWHTTDEIITGTGISERSAKRALPRLTEIRWLLRDGLAGRDGLRYRRNPDAGKVFR